MPRKNKYRTEQTNAMTESHQSEEKTLKTIQKGETTLELQQISVRLLTYTGETIPVLGSVVVPVEPNGQTRILFLIVTEGSGPFFLTGTGCPLCVSFGRQSSLLQQVLDKYSDVFK